MASTILLVTVTGSDKPGLMAMLTSTLCEYQARLLDVGQAIVHDQLALGFLVEVEAAHEADLRAGLAEHGRKQGSELEVQAVESNRYTGWVQSSGLPRYILTVMSDGGLMNALAVVSDITRQHTLNIDTVRRLTDRVAADRTADPGRGVLEIRLRGTPPSMAPVHDALLAASADGGFDYSLQEDSVYRRTRRLVAFDMDSTLINVEVIDELARIHGVGEQVASVTEQAMRGELDFKASFRARVKLLAGLPAAALEEVAGSAQLNEGAGRLLSVLRHFGYKTAVISGGFQHVGDHLKQQLGLDYVFANDVEVRDGVLTGAVRGGIVDAETKAQRLKQISEAEGIALKQTIAIGDGANDLPMLNAAGLGIAYHAKPIVRESAQHAISNFGLDAVLYLMGFSDYDLAQLVDV